MNDRKTYSGSIIVICAYKPKEGKESMLLDIMKTHVPNLRGQGLATNRPAIIMKAGDGTIVEVFEWVSQKAIEEAHKNPEVLKMWKTFEEACTYLPVGELDESKHMFSDFEPVNF